MNAEVTQEVKPVTQEDLELWYTLKQQLSDMRDQELELRNRIYSHYFVARDEHGVEILPKEGMNNFDLPDGFVLKGQRVVNRSVDAGSLDALKSEKNELMEIVQNGTPTAEQLARWNELKGLSFDQLIRYKPEVETRVYRELTDEQRQLFDSALVIKEGTPQLDIVKPKRKR